ncbi:MAG: hypothetical protein R3Y09_13600 [Clostridia bacterium]
MRNILNICHNGKYNYDHLYRYVEIKELKALIENKQIRFTNPSFWTATDEYETYFENWWLNKEHFKKWLNMFIDINTKRYATVSVDYDNIWMQMATGYVNLIMQLMPTSYCYCLTEDWIKSKKEHHEKWGKNILVCYKKDFWKKLSSFNKKVVFGGDYLYADIFPMHYIDSFESYIEKCSAALGKDEEVNLIINQGQFLKYSKYDDEKEVRIKLQYHFKGLLEKHNSHELLLMLQSKKAIDKEQFVDVCIDFLTSARQQYLEKLKQVSNIKKDGYFYLDLPTEHRISDMVESIKLSSNISTEEKFNVIELAKNANIAYEENVF